MVKHKKKKLIPNKFQILNIHKSKPNPVDLLINKIKLPSVTVLKDFEIYISESLK